MCCDSNDVCPPLYLDLIISCSLPCRFFNITVSIADIYRDGAAGTLGKKVLYFYFISTLLAVTNGCLMSISFSSLLSSNKNDDDDGGVGIELLCPKSYGKLSVLSSGIIQCLTNDDDSTTNASSNITHYDRFSLIDKQDLLVNDAMIQRTFLDQMLSTFESLVPSNVIQSFAVANIISIIIIGLVFGVAMTHLMNNHNHEHDLKEDQRNTIPVLKPTTTGGGGGVGNFIKTNDLEEANEPRPSSPRPFNPGAVFDFCREMSLICNLIIQWIVRLAPYCIAFLIAGSLSQAGLSGILFSSSPLTSSTGLPRSLSLDRQSGLSVKECGNLLHLCLRWDYPSLDHLPSCSLLFLHWREPLPMDLLLSTSSTCCSVHCF
jgi:hypothetical protein